MTSSGSAVTTVMLSMFTLLSVLLFFLLPPRHVNEAERSAAIMISDGFLMLLLCIVGGYGEILR